MLAQPHGMVYETQARYTFPGCMDLGKAALASAAQYQDASAESSDHLGQRELTMQLGSGEGQSLPSSPAQSPIREAPGTGESLQCGSLSDRIFWPPGGRKEQRSHSAPQSVHPSANPLQPGTIYAAPWDQIQTAQHLKCIWPLEFLKSQSGLL